VTAPLVAWRASRSRTRGWPGGTTLGCCSLIGVTAMAARGDGCRRPVGAIGARPAQPVRHGPNGRRQSRGITGVSSRTKLGGRADLQFAVSGPARDLHGGATVQLSRLFYNIARLDAATAHLDYQNGVVLCTLTSGVGPTRTADRGGHGGTQGCSEAAGARQSINLAAVLAPFIKTPASGTAYLVGQVRGTVRDSTAGGRSAGVRGPAGRGRCGLRRGPRGTAPRIE